MRRSWRPKHGKVLLTEEQIKGMLIKFDTDGDKKISRKELREGFKSLGVHFAGFRANSALRHADANGDGVISDEEINELADCVHKWGISIS